MATLSRCTDCVGSLAFSSDGRSLVSGSDDKTVKLWDIQTGGVVKVFTGHTGCVYSVSISADHTMIASGSEDDTICLWDIQTGECHCVIQQQGTVKHISFSPIDPQYILSVSNNKVKQWDINGLQISPAYSGSHVAFSPDGIQFVLCNKAVITVQNSDSRAIIAEFYVVNGSAWHCCL